MTDDVHAGVSLQISVVPRDAPHAREILPHQLRQWGGQVDEIVFTVDLGPPGTARAAESHQQDEITELVRGLCDENVHARAVQVDYGSAAADEVGQRFFGGQRVPRKDCYDNAVYPYFFGLHSARHRFVLHLDSDMLFGGGSQTWIAEARQLFGERADVFSCAPLPGPPGGRPFSSRVARGHGQSRSRASRAARRTPTADPAPGRPAFEFSQVSTRDFMIDRALFDDGGVVLRVIGSSPRMLLAATAKGLIRRGNPRAAPAERSLSRAMTDRGLVRIDFLGESPGMWSIHPPRRTAAFYTALPKLVARIEQGEIPDGQRGDYDLNESMLQLSGPCAGREHGRWRRWIDR